LGSKIYGIPDMADCVLVFDVSNNKASSVNTRAVARGPFKWQCAVTLGGRVYGVPFNAEKLLCYDPVANAVSGTAVDSVASGPRKWLAGVALDGKLYGVPCDATSMLVYDPVKRAVSGVEVDSIATGSFKWLSAVVVSSRIYGIPCNADCILIFDPMDGKVTSVSTASIATGKTKWVSAVVLGGKIYGIPDHAGQLLIFDPETLAVSGVDISAVSTGPYKFQAAVALGGRLYCAPHDSDNLLVYDASTGEASAISTSSVSTGRGKWGFIAAFGGLVYGVPYDAKKLLVHTPEVAAPPLQDGAVLPRDMYPSVIEDFVAAWLSAWIYDVEDATQPPPVPALQIHGANIDFTILKCHEEPMQGSPARLGIVLMTVPKGRKTMFVVFKGTSLYSDVVTNASLIPDYAPLNRVFGERTTFVHHGSHNGVTQLRVHEWASLCQFLTAAEDEGVGSLVICGHSLGGQYGMALLFEVFLDSSEPAKAQQLPPLLMGARCATFGAPMSFGAAEGAEMMPSLRNFFQERSVNYINACDPIARLWSEVDHEAFWAYFTSQLTQQIPGALRPLVDWAAGSGGIQKRAEEFLHRSDIESQVRRPARQYVHVSRIRMISNEFIPWRPLSQENMNLDDHSIVEYVKAWRNALDPIEAKAVYEEDGSVVHLTRGSFANLTVPIAVS
jgi:hypothetical protein